MANNAVNLLRMLQPSVRPAYVAPTVKPREGAAPLEEQSFAQLLEAAKGGKVHSGRQVEVACELHPPLSAAQMERLATAGDSAEASGSQRAMLMMDGRGLVMDVARRTIVGELSANQSAQMFAVDSTIYVARDDESQIQGVLPPPGGGVTSSAFVSLNDSLGPARSRERH